MEDKYNRKIQTQIQGNGRGDRIKIEMKMQRFVSNCKDLKAFWKSVSNLYIETQIIKRKLIVPGQ